MIQVICVLFFVREAAAGDHGCPDTPPPDCGTDCQCLPCGPSPTCHFYKCGSQWCDDQCHGCHSSVEHFVNFTGTKVEITSKVHQKPDVKETEIKLKGDHGCPDTPPPDC